ncbi:MAG: asparaginase [Paludibacteraceae bacterium]|nr:asparaginase [Paludibacteraceae bacterium]
MKVLVILTGGTITMVRNEATGALHPADTETFRAFVPELFTSPIQIDMLPFEPLIDSSDVCIELWAKIARTIESNYAKYDGFVVLHGTDTMAYTASALSFMLRHLSKPVIFTGSQLPIGVLRSDAKENLMTAIEIASEQDEQGRCRVPEVCIYFGSALLRANRTTKKNAEHFFAFESNNYPSLAKAGVHIFYRTTLIHYEPKDAKLQIVTDCDDRVVVLRLFPSIRQDVVHSILSTPSLRGVVLETYGSGNAPSSEWLYNELVAATSRGVVIVNKTQCSTGMVEMGRYDASINLMKAGVLSGYDITTEALLTKMMVLFGEYGEDTDKVKAKMQESLAGEISLDLIKHK